MSRLLYLGTETSNISLGARLLQIRDGMTCGHDEIPDNAILHLTEFTSKSISSAEQFYNNLECEALGILHRLEKFYHYCFTREVCFITDHKPLVAILSKNVAMLS